MSRNAFAPSTYAASRGATVAREFLETGFSGKK